MQDKKNTQDKENANEKDQPISKPDPETLHTTDPQEHMKGPISSLMQGLKKEAETPGKEDQDKVQQSENEKK